MEYYYTDGTNQPRGPVSQAELQQLASSGAITAATMVAAVGSQSWAPLSSVLTTVAPVTVAPTDPLAIWSLVLGIVSMVCCLGIVAGLPAVILGHLAIRNINRQPFVQGRGMAIAGLILGYVSCALSVLYIITMGLGAIVSIFTNH